MFENSVWLSMAIQSLANTVAPASQLRMGERCLLAGTLYSFKSTYIAQHCSAQLSNDMPTCLTTPTESNAG
jgi:hypothetical protein